MTIAEIHGKISGSGSNLSDRREDLLTSDVFGPLRYLPWEEGFLPVLSEAVLCSDPDEKLVIDGKYDGEPKVCFWPRMGRSEPDVLIEYGEHLLMIEAKYLSGKSGSHNEEDTENASSDQLAKEFEKLKEKKSSKYSLIYLTAHRTLPKGDIKSSYCAIGKEHKDDYKKNTYWLSWYTIYGKIKKLLEKEQNICGYKRLILDDIMRLLYKKNLRGFEGFSGLGIESVNAISGAIFYKRRNQHSTLGDLEETMSTDDVKNLFHNVLKIYEETENLLEDFSKMLIQEDFDETKRENKYHDPYAVFLFNKNSARHRLSVMVAFVDLDAQAITPRLVAGVVEHEEDAYPWGLWNAYFNNERNFTYTDEKGETYSELDRMDVEKMDGKVIDCSLNTDKQNSDFYWWPLRASYFAVPLLSIENYEDLKKLSKEAIRRWGNKAV